MVNVVPPHKNPVTPMQADTVAEKPLTAVLKQSEHVHELVQQSAQELSSVNDGLAHEVKLSPKHSKVRRELERSQAVESKVQGAADELSVVNLALTAEIDARHLLEAELVMVTQEEEAARYAALHDPLTGLPNRTLFLNHLELGLAQAKRHDRILALMFLDLDDFKKINDTFGHDAGDAVLKSVGHRLNENMREDDTVCRLGGDEFLYLFTEIESVQDAVGIAEKIRAAISSPCKHSEFDLTVHASIGIALYPRDATTPSELIKSADTAMYKAKSSQSGYAFASDESS